MKLTDLDAKFLSAGGEDVFLADGSPAPERHGVGVIFRCPCGAGDECPGGGWCAIAFSNPLDGGQPYCSPGEPTWRREGDTIETLTLTPSILRTPEKGGCGWHGWITAGEVRTC